MEAYYMSSLDSPEWVGVRRCDVLEVVSVRGVRRPGLIVRVDPPFIGQRFNRGYDIDEFVLLERGGSDLSEPTRFPLEVQVCFVGSKMSRGEGGLSIDDIESNFWAELYRDEADARAHRFDL